MPYAIRCLLVITAIFLLLGPRTASGLSIYDVIMLSQNRYEAENIVDIILTTGSAFTLTATDVVYLKNTGISDSVVQAMLVAVPPTESQEAETDSMGNMDWLNVTLEDLLMLADSEVSEAVILSFIKTRKRAFTMDASEMVKLYDAGLSDVVIQYLLVSESITIDDPADYYEPPTVSTDNYPITMEPYPRTVTSNRYPPDVPFYAYPRYYYEPSIFVGFGRIHHTLLRHHHVRLHHQREGHHLGLHHRNDHNIGLNDNRKVQNREEHHSGLHRKREHHVGLHDIEEGQHIDLHHLTPKHVSKYHSVNNSNARTPGIRKIRRMANSVIERSGRNITKTNGPGISHDDNQSAGRGFNSQVHRVGGNKLVSKSSHATNRTSTSPTAPRTTRHREKGSRGYGGRSTSRASTNSKSHDSAPIQPR
ncbi:MAG: hypothetical protein O6945_08195 [Gammaproteobacteria bacterium]|nr:hypothetical protein [Gammaproteobacteria bacterium]